MRRARSSMSCWILVAAVLLSASCAEPGDPAVEGDDTRPGGRGDETGAGEPPAALRRGIASIDSAAAAADSIFRPLPLLTPGQESSLRSFPNATQLARARQLGIARNLSPEVLQAHEREGRLVNLGDSEYWVVRDLDYSQPLIVPEARDLLREIGARFHARLASMGAPPFRFEISSVLRSAADQEALRAVNPNAALGESTHEYGTTVDVLYSAFAAPAEPMVEVSGGGVEWVEPLLDHYSMIAAERVAARRAMELKAILGEVLLELQREGRVMVTLERQQPVFHMTVAAAP